MEHEPEELAGAFIVFKGLGFAKGERDEVFENIHDEFLSNYTCNSLWIF